MHHQSNWNWNPNKQQQRHLHDYIQHKPNKNKKWLTAHTIPIHSSSLCNCAVLFNEYLSQVQQHDVGKGNERNVVIWIKLSITRSYIVAHSHTSEVAQKETLSTTFKRILSSDSWARVLTSFNSKKQFRAATADLFKESYALSHWLSLSHRASLACICSQNKPEIMWALSESVNIT